MMIERKTVALAVALVATTPAAAEEGGLSPWLKGASGFMSGLLPPEPGAYLTTEYYYYSGSAAAEVRGGNVELGIDTALNGGLVNGLFVTDWKFLGGQYAFGVTLGYIGLDLDATIQTQLGGKSVSLSNDGISDTILTPVLLGWHDGNLHWTVGLNAYVPTGSYDVGGLSTGRNVWGLVPQLGMTYFDPKSGLDLSGQLSYLTTSKNGATDYQSGDMLQFDFAAGLHFGGGWEAGIAGNVAEQISPDSGAGAKLGPFKEESFGLGPALSYTTKVGHHPLILSARWEPDLTHHDTFDGNVVAVSATMAF